MPTDSAIPGDLVALGVLRGSYGLQGWSHVQPLAADAQVLRTVRRWWLQAPAGRLTAAAAAALGGSTAAPLELSGLRAQGGGLVAKWKGCDDPEAAQALKGCTVAVARSDFPPPGPDQYYWVDLVGLQVINRQEQVLGWVRGLRSNGAHDVLEVAAESAGSNAGATANDRLIPMVASYIDGIDIAARRIRVDWQADW